MIILVHLLLLLLCVAGSSFFAGSETGFVSWNPLKVSHRAVQGDRVARWALLLMNHKDRVLSAVLIGNNICVVAASLTFALLLDNVNTMVAWDLERLPSAESWLLTPFMVLFGEMLPKSLFRIYPFRLTMRSVPVLAAVYQLTRPFTWFFMLFTNLLWREPLREGATFLTKVRKEMILAASEGSKRGTLFDSADLFIQNFLTLNDKTVQDVLGLISDRDAGKVLRVDDSVAHAKKNSPDGPGIIVFEKAGTTPFGYISLATLATAADEQNLHAYCEPCTVLRADQSLLSTIKEVADSENRLFVVADSNGATCGIIDSSTLLQLAFQGFNRKSN